jgi:phosphoserine phosphatase
LKDDIKWIIFDMDGVLVDIESSWKFIHRVFQVDNSKNLEKYLRGEINYKKFMSLDIQLWGPVHINQIKNILNKVPLMKGAKETIYELKKAGYKTAIISAGIHILANRIKKELGIKHIYANKLMINKVGMLTGEGEEAVRLTAKIEALRKLVLLEEIITRQCAVVGDTVYDIPLFIEAGYSIAFNTKDEQVKRAADAVIKVKDLTKILPYLT